ncbi:uncharacterized protein LOC108815278 [Raphanus sativus]|uniref:Uncharacterized protein LOC108815278 n=1 Tax=Raphanus sativus TaxID=3726 RepID=A0A6J0K787_RAPSA|nr:uncharacterized protein LOC108815278 [Raphanus sativus]
MLKSVLSAIPTYTMSCFPLPVGLCNQIQSALTRFWWDANSSERKMCWIAWDSLAEHKDDGGLGVRDIQDFNTAMLAKNAWRILTAPDSLLARLLLGKYCHNTSFLSTPCVSSASHGWRGITAGCRLLNLYLGRVIGNGSMTKVWSDSWISTTSHILPIGPPTESCRDLYVSDLLTRESRQWNQALVETVLPEFASQILLLRPSIQNAEDFYCWQRTKSSIYSVKSGYYALREDHRNTSLQAPQINPFDWQKHVWKKETSPKLKLFLWRLCRGALPLGANLQNRGIATPGSCPHCNAHETTMHLFMECPFAQQLWELAPFGQQLEFSNVTSAPELLMASSSWICLPPTGITSDLVSWLLWGIWNARNLLVFENRAIPAKRSMEIAIGAAREWLLAQNQAATLPKQAPPRFDQPPSRLDITLCNSDAAWSASSMQAGLGWHFVDDQASALEQGSCVLQRVSSPLMAEALAMREAVTEAKRTSLLKVWFRTDSLELARALNSKSYPVELYGVLMDIKLLSLSFNFFFVSFVGREHNVLADSLAKSALSTGSVRLY